MENTETREIVGYCSYEHDEIYEGDTYVVDSDGKIYHLSCYLLVNPENTYTD